MAADVDVANAALSAIGARPIAALTERSEEARACAAQFARSRDHVQRAHPWNCCRARTTLPVLAEAPAFGWAYQYQLPADCLRVLRVNDRRTQWAVEGRVVLCDDAAPIELLFIRRVEDVGAWDALLVSTVGAYLATQICTRLDDSAAKKDVLLKDYARTLAEARSIDGQEGVPPEPEDGEFLESRL